MLARRWKVRALDAEAGQSAAVRQMLTIRETLAVTRRELDRAELMLRVVKRRGLLDGEDAIRRSVAPLIALESEGDIEDAQRQVDEYLRLHDLTVPRAEAGGSR